MCDRVHGEALQHMRCVFVWLDHKVKPKIKVPKACEYETESNAILKGARQRASWSNSHSAVPCAMRLRLLCDGKSAGIGTVIPDLPSSC